jgi:2-dehydropantoate 2-reductase
MDILIIGAGSVGLGLGRLGESEETRNIMGHLAAETFEVMRLYGHATHWDSAGAYLKSFYDTMLPPTSAHESSMLQDLRAGRRTEIDALNGAIVLLAKKSGVDVPVNETITAIIKSLETTRSA